MKVDDALLHHEAEHNHDADPLLEEDLQLRRNMIQEARTSVYGSKIKTILINWRLRYDDLYSILLERVRVLALCSANVPSVLVGQEILSLERDLLPCE